MRIRVEVLFLAVVGCAILNLVLKQMSNLFFGRASWRPLPERGDMIGLPSGHSQMAAMLATIFYLAKPSMERAICLGVAVWLVMAERILTFRHTAFQTFAGAAVGTMLGVYLSSFVVVR